MAGSAGLHCSACYALTSANTLHNWMCIITSKYYIFDLIKGLITTTLVYIICRQSIFSALSDYTAEAEDGHRASHQTGVGLASLEGPSHQHQGLLILFPKSK